MDANVKIFDDDGKMKAMTFQISDDLECLFIFIEGVRYTAAKEDFIRLGIATIPLTYKSTKFDGGYNNRTEEIKYR